MLLCPLMNVETCADQERNESICVCINGIVIGIECLHERLRYEICYNTLAVWTNDAIIGGDNDRCWNIY